MIPQAHLESTLGIPPSQTDIGVVGLGKIIEEIKHDGICLPLYDPLTVAWDEQALRKTARRSPETTVVRYARVNPLARFSLDELLSTADKVFEKVAQACGARVVGHTWGFSVPPTNLRNHYYSNVQYVHEDLPTDVSLVSQVEILRDIELPSDAEWYVMDRTIRHMKRTEQYIWTDGGPKQFTKSLGSLVLTDIEPLVQPRNTQI